MYLNRFDYLAPTSVAEAVAMLAEHPDAKVLSGGMSLIPMMKLRLLSPAVIIDLGGIPDLDRIDDAGDHLVVGAMVPHRAVATSVAIREHAPSLADAAAWTGDPQVRNRGTLCGALAHGDPAADATAPALALGATMVVRSADGTREIPAAAFFTDAFTTDLTPQEVLVEVRIPKRARGETSAYDKLGRRGGHTDFAVAGVAAWVRRDAGRVLDARIAVTGVGSRPLLSAAGAAALIGTDGSAEAVAAASTRVAEDVEAIEDLFGSAAYKSHLTRVYATRAMTLAIAAG